MDQEKEKPQKPTIVTGVLEDDDTVTIPTDAKLTPEVIEDAKKLAEENSGK